jgi:transcriptional regulator with XRE-family HTH domain
MIERNLNSPTAVVLDKLATGLGVTLSSLFDTTVDANAPNPLAPRATQPRWKDPASGYLRRSVSPSNWPSPIRIVEVEFPPGATVAYETGTRDPAVHQQVWVLSGEIEIVVGDAHHHLSSGDCLAMLLDTPITFRNGSARASRYVVVTASEPSSRRSAPS